MAEPVCIQPQTQTSQIRCSRLGNLRIFKIQRSLVILIITGYPVIQGDRISHGPSHWADVIKRLRQCEHPMTAHPAVGRFKPGYTVGHGWIAYGAAGIGSDSRETQTCRYSHARAGRRHPRPQLFSPRVFRNRKFRIVGRQSAFGQIEFTQQHCTGLIEFSHHRRIKLWHEMLPDFQSAHGSDSGGVAQILYRDRHTMQQTPIPSGPYLFLSKLCLRPGQFRGDGRIAE